MNIHEHCSTGVGDISHMYTSINTTCQVLVVMETDNISIYVTRTCTCFHQYSMYIYCLELRFLCTSVLPPSLPPLSFLTSLPFPSLSPSLPLTQMSHVSTVSKRQFPSSMALIASGQFSIIHLIFTALKYVLIGSPQRG